MVERYHPQSPDANDDTPTREGKMNYDLLRLLQKISEAGGDIGIQGGEPSSNADRTECRQ